MDQPKKRPLVWLHAYTDENPTKGVHMKFKPAIEQDFDVITYSQLKEAPHRAKDILGAIVYGGVGLALLKEQLSDMTSLKCICNFGVGVDHLDVPALNKKGIKVTNTPHVLDNAVAEIAMTLLLTSSRNIIQAMETARAVPAGGVMMNAWSEGLEGATVGIVGMGNIGVKIARLARAFSANIVYHNRNPRPAPVEEELQAQFYPSLYTMLPVCDYVIVACPLTSQTTRLIGGKELKCMKKSATLVNISRGKVVDTAALHSALTTGEIHAACLDVTEPEPLPTDHPLLSLHNCLITPHIGSATTKARTAMMDTVLSNLRAALITHEPLPNEVQE